PEPALIGSLCALGHGDTAKILFEQGAELLMPDEHAFSLYLLALNNLRMRNFAEARSHLASLASFSKRCKGVAEARMFARLGLGQSSFYDGRLGMALEHATAALELALTAEHDLGKLWCYELVAQTQS